MPSPGRPALYKCRKKLTLTMESQIIDLGKQKAKVEDLSLSQFVCKLIKRHRATPISEKPEPKKPTHAEAETPIDETEFEEPTPLYFGD